MFACVIALDRAGICKKIPVFVIKVWWCRLVEVAFAYNGSRVYVGRIINDKINYNDR